MAVYRVQRTRDYTVMSNYHLKDKGLTLKSKGLLSMILSLPEEWNYTTRGLASICKEGVDAIGSALKELETAGYIVRRQLRGANGRITDTEYIIYEQPQPKKLDILAADQRQGCLNWAVELIFFTFHKMALLSRKVLSFWEVSSEKEHSCGFVF